MSTVPSEYGLVDHQGNLDPSVGTYLVLFVIAGLPNVLSHSDADQSF